MLPTPYLPHPFGLLTWCFLAAIAISLCLPSYWSRKPLIQLFLDAEPDQPHGIATWIAEKIAHLVEWCIRRSPSNGDHDHPFPPRPLAPLAVRQNIAIWILPKGGPALGEVLMVYGKILVASSTLYIATNTAVKITLEADFELLGEVVHCEVRENQRMQNHLTIRLRHLVPLTDKAYRKFDHAA